MLVVVGHTFPVFREYIYLFHIAVFLMASGYCWNDNSVNNVASYRSFIIRKIRALYVPYVLYNGLFLVLHNVFVNLNIYSNDPSFITLTKGSAYSQHLTYYFPLGRIMRETIKVLCGIGTQELGSATWFLIALFIIVIFHGTISFITKNIRNRNIVFYILLAVMLIASVLIDDLPLRGEIRRFPATYVAFLLGYFLRNLKIKSLYSPLMIPVSAGILLVMVNFGNIELSAARIVNPFFYIICSLCGWILLMSTAKLIMKSRPFSKCLIYVGKHTMPILALHLLSFKLVSLMYILVHGRPICLLASFHILFETPSYYWIFYTIIGVAVPFMIDYAINHIKTWIYPKFKTT
ncbi:MAG: hypothetical protein MR840_04490 [Solobacterium sp.]|nr:hypothetical protein [Solobacterium sp.]